MAFGCAVYAVAVCEDQQKTWAESLTLCGDILKALAVEHCASAFPTAEALDEVRYVESCDHGSVYHMQTGQRFRPLSLSETETALPQERFCHCHNSFLVNMEHIALDGWGAARRTKARRRLSRAVRARFE